MGRPNKRPRPATSGILVVDKPAGRSSMSAVAEVRRKAGGARTGHAGTLDPLATGVLVLALGRATKVIDRLMATDKRYRTRIDLSAFTETDDLEGAREPVEVAEPPGGEAVAAAVAGFVGTIQQRPPAYSAVKVGGRRAYAMARKGEAVDLPARPVVVHAIEVVSYDWPLLDLDIHCAKGLYVRSLARDLGVALGAGGHCVSIRRTAVGPFTLDEAVTLEEVPEPLTEEGLMSIEEALGRVGPPGA
jgi:tRNA pseudouridine55 synthase